MRTSDRAVSGTDAPCCASVSPRCLSSVKTDSYRCDRECLRRRDRGVRRRVASEALFIRALDAPMPFDFEHKAKNIIAKRKQLKIGIVGFGTFGQFLAGRLVAAGHQARASFLSSSLTTHHCGACIDTGAAQEHSNSHAYPPLTLIVSMQSALAFTNPSLIQRRPHAGVSNVQN